MKRKRIIDYIQEEKANHPFFVKDLTWLEWFGSKARFKVFRYCIVNDTHLITLEDSVRIGITKQTLIRVLKHFEKHNLVKQITNRNWEFLGVPEKYKTKHPNTRQSRKILADRPKDTGRKSSSRGVVALPLSQPASLHSGDRSASKTNPKMIPKPTLKSNTSIPKYTTTSIDERKDTLSPPPPVTANRTSNNKNNSNASEFVPKASSEFVPQLHSIHRIGFKASYEGSQPFVGITKKLNNYGSKQSIIEESGITLQIFPHTITIWIKASIGKRTTEQARHAKNIAEKRLERLAEETGIRILEIRPVEGHSSEHVVVDPGLESVLKPHIQADKERFKQDLGMVTCQHSHKGKVEYIGSDKVKAEHAATQIEFMLLDFPSRFDNFEQAITKYTEQINLHLIVEEKQNVNQEKLNITLTELRDYIKILVEKEKRR